MNMSCQTEVLNNQLSVAVARTAEEKMEVYRFRYRVYIEEMSMQIENADHKRKMIFDELDNSGLLIYAQAGGEIVGTQRLNIGKIKDFPSDLVQYLSWERFQTCYSGQKQPVLAYTSKLMVDERYRNTPVLHLITSKGYELYWMHDVQFNFGACNFHLLRLYEQFGCRRYGASFTAPGYDGVLTPVVLIVEDTQHLRAVRSPFYRLARKRRDIISPLTAWFYSEFKETSAVINSQLVSEEALWTYLTVRLGCLLDYRIPILEGLSLAEVKKFLHCCAVIVSCRSGEQIAIQHYYSHTHKILLTGKLAVVNDYGLKKSVMPGESFGTSGLISQARYSADVFAVTQAEVLVLSRLNFERFRFSHPAIASKIIRNLAR